MTDLGGGPAYQLMADDLRKQMSDGRLPVGAPLPSTSQLMARYGVSSTVARAAVNQLRAAGLVVGAPGKAVYVKASPGENEGPPSYDELADAVRSLRAEVHSLRGDVGTLRAELIDLYARTGQPYAGHQERESKAAPRRRRASGEA